LKFYTYFDRVKYGTLFGYEIFSVRGHLWGAATPTMKWTSPS